MNRSGPPRVLTQAKLASSTGHNVTSMTTPELPRHSRRQEFVKPHESAAVSLDEANCGGLVPKGDKAWCAPVEMHGVWFLHLVDERVHACAKVDVASAHKQCTARGECFPGYIVSERGDLEADAALHSSRQGAGRATEYLLSAAGVAQCSRVCVQWAPASIAKLSNATLRRPT